MGPGAIRHGAQLQLYFLGALARAKGRGACLVQVIGWLWSGTDERHGDEWRSQVRQGDKKKGLP